MEHGRLSQIKALALPIIGGMVSQNVLNLVDTAMVGRLDNPTPALAAVSIGGFANFMCMSLLLGISTGVQATASRRKGEGNIGRMAVSLNAGLILVLLIAPLFSALLFTLVPRFFHVLNSDPEVMANGIPYLQARILGITFIACNFCFRGYWNGVNLSKLYMQTLFITHASNIFLNWVLIFGHLGSPAYGATGAGMATSLSTVIAFVVYIYLGRKYAAENGFLKAKPIRSEFATLARLSLPNGIQQLFFSAGFVTLFWIIGKVGTVETGAAGVLINIMMVGILPGIGLGLSSATLVGQALGRKDPADAKRWGWDVVKVGLIALAIIGLPMVFLTDYVLMPFLRQPEALEVARMPLRLVGIALGLEAIGLILMNSLLGAGASKKVMVVSIIAQWFFFLPGAYIIGPVLGYGLLAIWSWQLLYRLSLSAIFAIIWHRGRWASIVV